MNNTIDLETDLSMYFERYGDITNKGYENLNDRLNTLVKKLNEHGINVQKFNDGTILTTSYEDSNFKDSISEKNFNKIIEIQQEYKRKKQMHAKKNSEINKYTKIIKNYKDKIEKNRRNIEEIKKVIEANKTDSEITEKFNYLLNSLENENNTLEGIVELFERRLVSHKKVRDALRRGGSIKSTIDNVLDNEAKEKADKIKNDSQNRVDNNNNIEKPPKPNENVIDAIDEQINKNSKPIMPVKKGNKPKVTFKTIMALAAGVGLGATVFFTTGPAGVGIMMAAGGIAKTFIKKQEKKLATATSLNAPAKVEEIENPKPQIKGPIARLKRYLTSPEGLRDMRWMINAAMLTGAGLTIGQAAAQYFGSQAPTSSVETITQTNTPSVNTPSVETITQTNTQSVSAPSVSIPQTSSSIPGYDSVSIGESIGQHNINVGYDSASWALNGQNGEILNPDLVNAANSQFGRFRISNLDGTSTIIDQAGTSIQDLLNQGYNLNQIAIDVTNTHGASQAWISAESLGNGGMTL